MNADIFSKLEKAPYPAAIITPHGENLRVFTKNETAFVPPVRTPALIPSHTFPICVPTTRHILKNRKNFRRIMQLADSENTLLIFLCSGLAKKDHIEILAHDFPNLQWMAIDGPFHDSSGTPPFTTSISPLSYGGDLAQKRNFTLHLAKLMNWKSVFLLDDDILITNRQIKKTRTLLAEKNVSIVGFNARSFPDNSVAVHVHRWIRGSMDSFLGGGVLAIKMDTPFLSFFPRIYNEDWIFMLIYKLIGEGDIVWADTVQQRPYNPYKVTSRAINEEAGDIVGESLAKLMHVLCDSDKHYKTPRQIATVLRTYANENFWDTEINNRLDYLYKLSEGLHKKRLRFYRSYQAKRAIRHSIRRILGTNGHPPITGKQLADWVDAWCHDIEQWNITLNQSTPCKTLTEALHTLSIPSENVAIGTNIEALDRHETPIAPAKHSPKQYIYEGYTVRPRSLTILENLWLAKAVEEYLADKDLSIKKIASSANMLRFDRPTHWVTDIKPDFTVSIMVAYGEPVAQIHRSVLNIISWSKNTGPFQLLLWVYDDSGRSSSKSLELYRNRLTAQLVHDIRGTHVQLRSGIIAKTSNIQDVISQSLDDISFAYWKQKIKAKHPIYVINSQNELLRLGTFCQFMHHEQLLPRRSLKYHIRKHTATRVDSPGITQESDAVSLRVSRESLTQAPQRRASMKATKTMLHHMHKAQLTWISIDDLAYSIIYHHSTGEDSLEHPKKIVCIPVEYGTTPIRDFTSIFSRHHGSNIAYFIVIHGTTDHSWEALDSYHDEVLSRLTAIYPHAIIFSTSYRLSPGEGKKYFKRRITALARYARWLQNHDDTPAISIVK